MIKAICLLASTVVIASQVAAGETVQLQLAGRDLNPGDSYTVAASLEFVVVNPSKNAEAPRRADARIDESMIEGRQRSGGRADWQGIVLADRAIFGRAVEFPFDGPLAPVARRLTLLLVDVRFTRSGVGPNGEIIGFSAQQKFPVRVEKHEDVRNLCLIFEGTPNGEVTVGVRPDCSESVRSDPDAAGRLNVTGRARDRSGAGWKPAHRRAGSQRSIGAVGPYRSPRFSPRRNT